MRCTRFGLVTVLAACGGDRAAEVDAATVADATSPDAMPPELPADLMRWIVGNPGDVAARPTGGVILMGGGTDVDAAFAWQRDRIDGGDVVVLRASGADGYNDY